eukprot:180999-Pleurochrysis_carterae.AAC.1
MRRARIQKVRGGGACRFDAREEGVVHVLAREGGQPQVASQRVELQVEADDRHLPRACAANARA